MTMFGDLQVKILSAVGRLTDAHSQDKKASLVSRFTELDGREKTIRLLIKDTIIDGNESVAKYIYENSEKLFLSSGEVFIRQGDLQDSVYFLIYGTIEVSVKGKVLKRRREAPSHVGEMAAYEPNSPRSATVSVVDGPAFLLKLPSERFQELCSSESDFRELVAHEISERRKFWMQPNTEMTNLSWVSTIGNFAVHVISCFVALYVGTNYGLEFGASIFFTYILAVIVYNYFFVWSIQRRLGAILSLLVAIFGAYIIGVEYEIWGEYNTFGAKIESGEVDICIASMLFILIMFFGYLFFRSGRDATR